MPTPTETLGIMAIATLDAEMLNRVRADAICQLQTLIWELNQTRDEALRCLTMLADPGTVQ